MDLVFFYCTISSGYKDRAVSGNADLVIITVGDEFNIFKRHFTIHVGHRLTAREHAAGRTTDVERSQGELRTRFPNGLGGNNTDRVPGVALGSGCQGQAVTFGADAVSSFARKHGANAHRFYAVFLYFFGLFQCDQIAFFDDGLFFFFAIGFLYFDHYIFQTGAA